VIFLLQGLVIHIRKPEIRDLDTIAQWLASDAYVANIGGARGMGAEQYRRKAEAMLQDNADDYSPNKYYLVEDRFNGTPVGLAMLCKIDWKNRHAEFAYIVGESNYRVRLTAGDINVVLYNYFFNELNLNKVYGYVFATNTTSLRMNAFGGRQDGTLRRHKLLDGKPIDVHVLSISRPEFAGFVDRHAHTLLKKHIERGLIRHTRLQ
jgi:RimJ/RimL family protein N-acetyltransferase